MDFTDASPDSDPATNGDGGEEQALEVIEMPAPEQATADDLAKYNMEWAQRNPRALIEERTPGAETPGVDLPYAKQLSESTKHKSKYPWLYEPERGVRWDFDPIQLRNIAQEDTWAGMLIQSITKEISETPWTITKADGPLSALRKRAQTHPEQRTPIAKADTLAGELPDTTSERIAELLISPNPDIDWQDFCEMSMADLLEVGSAATVKAFHESAYSGEEFRADPETVEPRALMPTAPEVWTKGYQGKTGLLNGYYQFDRERSPGTGDARGGMTGTRGYQTAIPFDTPEVMWTDISPRTNRRYGMPPTLLVKDFLESVDLAVEQEQQYLSRGSIPSGAWVFDEYDREELKELKEEQFQNVQGKPHKSLVFAGKGGDVKYEPMSMNFKELQFTERMKWYARVIASAFQVPTAVVGIEPEKVNYNTFQGERENFEENTLGPYLQKLERWINDQLIAPHWGREYHFEFKPGISESTRGMISERVRNEWNANLIQRSTALRELGKELPDDAEDGYKADVVDDGGEEGPLGGLGDIQQSADDPVRKNDPLRETKEWYLFDVQPGMVDDLQADIAEDIRALYDEVLSDERVQEIIDRLAAEEDGEDIAKSITSLARRLRELIEQTRLGGEIADAIREHSAEAVSETLEETIQEADGAPADAIDVERITARLRDRDIGFAQGFADDVAADIRETVGDGWAEGLNSREIAEDIADDRDIAEGWGGAERIARQELQVATGEARSAVADELDKVEVWNAAGGASGDGRNRDAHLEMHGTWKRPGDDWVVDYSDRGRGVEKESVPGNSEPGIGCRCVTLLRDIEEVDREDYAGDGSLN